MPKIIEFGPSSEVKINPLLEERLDRVKRALVELSIARSALDLQTFEHDEIEAAYITTRVKRNESQKEIDNVDRSMPGYSKNENYQRIRNEYSAYLDMEHNLRVWVMGNARAAALEAEQPETLVNNAGIVRLGL